MVELHVLKEKYSSLEQAFQEMTNEQNIVFENIFEKILKKGETQKPLFEAQKIWNKKYGVKCEKYINEVLLPKAEELKREAEEYNQR